MTIQPFLAYPEVCSLLLYSFFLHDQLPTAKTNKTKSKYTKVTHYKPKNLNIVRNYIKEAIRGFIMKQMKYYLPLLISVLFKSMSMQPSQ